jgi:biopolymer transport protein ExbD
MLRARRRPDDREVDLAALVDVLSNMLFFLLATVTFLQLKTLNAAVPALSTGDVSTGKGVDVSVEIRAAGYRLKADGSPADVRQPALSVDKELPRRSDGELDTRALTRELWEVKKVAPEAKNILLFPEAGILFDDIVKTMDAARDMPSILDARKRVPLFTRPVLSELTTAADAAPELP